MANQVLFNCFEREPPELRSELQAAAKSVLDSNWWILGNYVKQFEESFSRYIGVTQTIGVANGLDAIEISLRSLGIGHGDEVITTSMTAFATVLAIYRCGATPVFADVQIGDACLDLGSVERCIGPHTKAIIPVHLYGQALRLDKLAALCADKNLFLIEDCAQAHGASFYSQKVGSFGDLAAWSFYPTKNLGAVGDAGAITTNSQSLAQKCRSLRNYGQTDRYTHEFQGLNSRLDELQAALLCKKLPYLDRWTSARRLVAYSYWDKIDNPYVQLLDKPLDRHSHVHHLFVVKVSDRQSFQSHMSVNGVQTLIHYPIPSHLQKAISTFRIDPNGLTNCELLATQCVSLPVHPFLIEDEIDCVVSAVNSYR